MNVCIYGASSDTIAKCYINPVEELGRKLAAHGHSLVFGGGKNGLMGAAARGFKSCGGRVVGVAPEFFRPDGVLFEGCDDFVYTSTMRERKEIMENRSDAFIVTPGGPGTLDEFFEIFTLRQLGRHNKPVAVFNVHGYYNELYAQLEKAVNRQFMKSETLKSCPFFDSADRLIAYLESANIFKNV